MRLMASKGGNGARPARVVSGKGFFQRAGAPMVGTLLGVEAGAGAVPLEEAAGEGADRVASHAQLSASTAAANSLQSAILTAEA